MSEYNAYCARKDCRSIRAVSESDGRAPGWFELHLNIEDSPNYWEFCSPDCLRRWVNNPGSLAEEIAFERELLAAVRALGASRD